MAEDSLLECIEQEQVRKRAEDELKRQCVQMRQELEKYRGAKVEQAQQSKTFVDSVRDVLTQRGKRYGEFSDHAQYSQKMKSIWMSSPGYIKANATQREAMDMILHKIARAMNGDPAYDDTWIDIAGYAQLVVDQLRGK